MLHMFRLSLQCTTAVLLDAILSLLLDKMKDYQLVANDRARCATNWGPTLIGYHQKGYVVGRPITVFVALLSCLN